MPGDYEEESIGDCNVDTRHGGQDSDLQRGLKNRHAQMISRALPRSHLIGLPPIITFRYWRCHPHWSLFGRCKVPHRRWPYGSSTRIRDHFLSSCIRTLCLGGLTTLFPVPGGRITLAGRFVDLAMDFAMGRRDYSSLSPFQGNPIWAGVFLFFGGITGILGLLPSILRSATAYLINYAPWFCPATHSPLMVLANVRRLNHKIDNAVWITITDVVVIINFLGTHAFGEFWFATIKVPTTIGLIVPRIILDMGGGPTHVPPLGMCYAVSRYYDRLGRWLYPLDVARPGSFTQYHDIPGATGRFAGVWSVFVGVAYALLGTEILGMTTAETRNPTKNVPIALVAYGLAFSSSTSMMSLCWI